MKKRDILKVIDATLLCAVVAVVITVHGDTAQTETTTNIVPEIPVVEQEAKQIIEAHVEMVVEVPAGVEAAVEIEDEPCPLEVATFYDVPLSEELQAHIILECKFYGVEPEIVLAMIERESRFQADVMGDNGNAYGLMQIHPRWHSDRMERLGVTDLMNPYQNTTTGIDFLAEQIDRYDGDVAKALVAYNQGHFKGTVTKYALAVMERAEELRSETYEVLQR
jgi:hypothetical protein